MIKFENYEVVGWEHAIRGMRNPKNSWDRSDSYLSTSAIHDGWSELGEKDHELMMKLAKGGPVHAKYRRMITVYVDITAPLYWWKEFDTYKVGTVANSCSTMHKIHAKEFELSDFSTEKLISLSSASVKIERAPTIITRGDDGAYMFTPKSVLSLTIDMLNKLREEYLKHKDGCDGIYAKELWYNMIQLLPTSYNQKRTIMMNYEVLTGIYEHRKNHKLDEWHKLCDWIEELPYSEIITGEK